MMNFRTFLLTSAVTLISTTAFAEVLSPGTDTFAEVGKEGPWTIYADGNRRSCLIEGTDGAGTVVQMGLISDKTLGYVGVFTPTDAGLGKGGDQTITIEVNGHAYSGTATMREHGLADGYQGGYFLANNPQFIEDMMAGQKMIAFSDKSGKGVEVDLTGSRAAIEAASSCTAQLSAQ
ncbi:hypothetical protein [Paracoccus lutimaris]|uniref:Invasion protein IalB n=1 Tax=Paracoccus lutimaris TaxID=1490030 RepID=A0A368YRN2_9RHOB|nr:hypothetical protein [Paracoccus lutimaris]RCW82881.1 hypothetical protein DFP89_11186 [Paracoccus lutimaris]